METSLDCFIAIMGGACRSSKSIYYDPSQKLFLIINEIDDTEGALTAKELSTKSNVGTALKEGALFRYG